ncbi:MAG: ABC-F family ATP-binding cassette domain-containing protein [Oscillospiraceae bacterium]|nr:ABC-F family ATP-binding cassette domain-containing protein [Oscillospiraceae bacterium]
MIDISVRNLVKAYEVDKNILDGVSFEIQAGERVGLLGKNGAGKTTLFRLLSGEIEKDEGEIVIGPGKRLGLISQIPRYPADYTTEDVLKEAHARLYKLQTELECLAEQMADSTEGGILTRYDRTLSDFERLGGYEMETDRNRICGGLDIPAAMREQPFATLSGGEKTRVNLARLILEKTDILLLDEPTNHLDLKSTQWLETYLERFPGTVLVISHDRYFLDTVVTRTIEIAHGKAAFYSGNYSYYIDEKARREEEQRIRYEREQAEIKRLGTRAEQMTGWGTGNKKMAQKAKAMRSRIARMERTQRPDSEKRLHARLSEKEFRGDELMVIKKLAKSYDGRTLFEDLNLEVGGGERIALIGDNGTGKSTLIKVILGEESADIGSVKFGPAVKKAYLPQHIRFENPSRSMMDTLIYELGVSPQTARNRLGAFKFHGEDVYTPVSALSGGEQSRLRLCMLMEGDVNFLILDEPTNHLDIQSREWIEEVLEDYTEALLFVSHDRYFISRFATRIWTLEGGQITDFHGTYEEYLRRRAQDEHYAQIEKTRTKKEKKPGKQKNVSPEKLLAKLEKEITALEEQKTALEAETEAKASDYEALMELESQAGEVDTQLAALYAEWEAIAEGKEAQSEN